MYTLRSIARSLWHSAWLIAFVLAVAALASRRVSLATVFAGWGVVALIWLLAVRQPAVGTLFSPGWRRNLPLALIWLGIVLTPLASSNVRARLFRSRVATPALNWSINASEGEVANVVAVAPTDWPCWRGPAGTGIAVPDSASGWKVPTQWSPTQNMVWKSPLEGRGHASPVVVGKRVYIATADEQSQGLLCFDAEQGKLLWKRKVLEGREINIHPKNSHASPTPVANERLVCVSFLADYEGKKGIWVTALDHAGRIQWQRFAGEFTNVEGYGASPAVYEGVLFVTAEGLQGGFVTALDIDTGAVRWQTPRDVGASYASPIVGDTSGRMQLILAGCTRVSSYDPTSGRPTVVLRRSAHLQREHGGLGCASRLRHGRLAHVQTGGDRVRRNG